MRVFTVRYVSGVFSHEGEALDILSQYGKDWRYSADTHRGSHFFGEIKFKTFVVGLTIFLVDAEERGTYEIWSRSPDRLGPVELLCESTFFELC
jgi:hypothetical protein